MAYTERMRRRWSVLLLTASIAVAACSADDAADDSVPPETAPTETAPAQTASPDTSTVATLPPEQVDAPPLEVALVWHQHQPRYPVVDGLVSRPWVRVHATKDYLDMVERVDAYEDLRLTFNLTPSLLLQLQELSAGARDLYADLSATPVAELTEEQRTLLTERFFDVNPAIVERFPRYAELAAADRSTFDDRDLQDLQVLFNLAWTDPTYLARPPLDALVELGADFDQEDVATVLGVHQELVDAVIDAHAERWADGRIELTTTPLAHPILPLLADTDLALQQDPQAVVPADPFREYADAREHVELGLDLATELFGDRPTGMWPGEGAVAQEVVKLWSDAEVDWVATGEDVLARSLGIGSFERVGDVVRDADLLYRPWLVRHRDGSPPVAVFFRDTRLADLIGFEYSGTDADEAVADLIGRLGAIRSRLAEQGAEGPHLVTIVLDGENAWEYYPEDGGPFLDALYTALTTTDWLRTTTPTEFLERHGDALEELPAPLAAGSWIGGTLSTWIGEPEEARAWELLRTARLDLRRAEQQGAADEELAAAHEAMRWAQGSDWFWWFGDDQDSGDDAYFDRAYRELLGQVYDALGLERPAWVAVPIVPATPVEATTTEDGAGVLEGEAGRLRLAVDDEQLTITTTATGPFEVYVRSARGGRERGTSLDGAVLGFGATQVVRYDGTSGCAAGSLPPVGTPELIVACEPVTVETGTDGAVTLAVDAEVFGGFQTGDRIWVQLRSATATTPTGAPGLVVAPDIGGFEVLLDVEDPTGDDHGPGTYTYPTDPVFPEGVFDLTRFQLGRTEDEIVLVFDLAAPIANPWNSPTGLAVQTFDVYLDTEPGTGADTGDRLLLGGRNAALGEDDRWEAAVAVEGWMPKVVRVVDGSRVEDRGSVRTTVVGDQGRVIVRVPREAIGADTDPSTWRVAVAVLGQEGYPSSGVDRVRDVAVTAAQWRFGGGTGDANDTRIIDLLHPEPGEQESLLSARPTTSSPQADLTADDVTTIPLLP
jgi:alpha-amylase/alpha-mannosidase (GH57 family)